ncbi:MAG TPA: NAD-dependent succinate-semialdehyde dehydrogenase [Ohtaekwangia sp.]|nr:NAD-dependent succinate-semialdehyde dehydrogenase [Ohtaekwangia sp.]
MHKSINPYNQALLGEFPVMNESDIESKLAKSHLAFCSWKTTSFAQRSGLLTTVSGLLRSNKEEYARVISLEMGKSIHESRSEVEKCASGCDYFAEHGERFLADEEIKTEAQKSLIAFQPVGSILAIMPWNFPFWQVFRFAAPTLMAGNAALLKHSSNVPQCSLLIEKIFHKAGFPDGVFQSLLIRNTDVEKLIASDHIQGVSLTGSEKAGSSVAALAGKHIKKTVLELGGSDPFVVLADADINHTVKIATQSRMQNAGQSCIAAKRFIVDKKIKDSFIENFCKQIEALRQGDPLDEHTTTGPMARLDLAEELESQLKRSEAKGAQLITGGSRKDSNFKPALLDHVKPGMPAFDEETFGPLASVITVETEKEAIDMANTNRYGLGASVWTSDIQRGEYVARQIESGCVFVNSLMRSDSRLPFGGIKKSGYGRELSQLGIREFVNAKTIYIQ